MDQQRHNIRFSLLLTGDEILKGDIVDTNSAFMSKELAAAGLKPVKRVTVGDDLGSIVKALRELSQDSDIILVNGGLGSTVDDLSARAAALAIGVELVENRRVVESMENKLGRRYLKEHPRYGEQIRKQAQLPKGSDIVENTEGLAPGFKVAIGQAMAYFTPGVPREMKAMLRDLILPDILSCFGKGTETSPVRFQITGIGESRIQQWLFHHFLSDVWQDIQLGFRAGNHSVEVKLSAGSPAGKAAVERVSAKITRVFREFLIPVGKDLYESVVDDLRAAGARVTTAESCTGGLLASHLTAVPGVSDVFEAGMVTYSNRSKHRLLHIDKADIERFGAVSVNIAEQMVRGALGVTSADYAIAVTGIAGPTGGTPEKPLGTVFIAWGEPSVVYTRRLWIKRERRVFQRLVSDAAADLLRRHLHGYPTDHPFYFDELTRDQRAAYDFSETR